ncbi:Aldehyde ferredoxin oxidoreductase, C-terminal [Moorella glycerini]|uniref:Oxidoreductase YdhV n=1 Tax=Neomoorella stamsii TaxID=1266720 RepID=A0A9X7J4M4_9FIRM|nr:MULTISPECIES: aldehyde ferredoxin oxidoreductase family protein [Moorella]PRR73579.1 putative oxidoreductase YdhV [Moorella stamsii]CEP69348.1 Aldehyde ferredoxin oxidoreductase, C-terminal [Moorella glycerini]
MLYGYRGKLLQVDLNTGEASTLDIPESYLRSFIGGKALGAKLLLDRKLFRVDPLGAENEIIALTGPVTGTLVPGVGKALFFSKSPLTGGYLDSAVGGRLSHNIKMAGYDGLIISSRSDQPVYLVIDNERIELKPADQLWGKGCFQTEICLRERYGSDAAVATIGPAGENLVRYAMVQCDFYHQAGRGGLGAVFGSKNLKAIVVLGNMPLPLYAPEDLFNRCFQLITSKKDDQNIRFRIKYGTLSTLDGNQKLGIAVVRNFRDGVAGRYDIDMNRDYFREHLIVRDMACFGCAVPCGKVCRIERDGENIWVGGPEYETMALLGTNLELSAEDLVYLSWLCDDLGLDTVSSGNILGFVAEALEKGLIKPETIGVTLDWGKADGFAKVLRAIAYRQGAGKVLAEGVRKVAEHWNIDPDMAIHVKGMELPGYDPRGTTGYALEYAVADRGGCHRRARPLRDEIGNEEFRFAYEGKALLVKDMEDVRAFHHSLPVCDFLPPRFGLKIPDYLEMLLLITGINMTVKEAKAVGERAVNLARCFNYYCGITPKDDTLPGRFFKEPLPRGGSVGKFIKRDQFQRMLSEYYQLRGWDLDGKPTDTKLKELGLMEGNDNW